jgi:hypothetical protein
MTAQLWKGDHVQTKFGRKGVVVDDKHPHTVRVDCDGVVVRFPRSDLLLTCAASELSER